MKQEVSLKRYGLIDIPAQGEKSGGGMGTEKNC